MTLDVDAVVFDLDGVVWHEYVELDGAAEVIQQCQARDVPIAFLTNMSSREAQFLTSRLRRVGLNVPAELVITAGGIVAEFLVEHHAMANTVAVVHAEKGALLKQIKDAGVPAVSLRDLRTNPEAIGPATSVVVVVGSARSFTHADGTALLAIAPRVGNLYAADRDRSFATADGSRPGAGWVVAAAEALLGQAATVLGKPSPTSLSFVARRLGVDVRRILMVGDSLDSDIAAAKAVGAIGCLFVATGAASAASSGARPDLVLERLSDLVPLVFGEAST